MKERGKVDWKDRPEKAAKTKLVFGQDRICPTCKGKGLRAGVPCGPCRGSGIVSTSDGANQGRTDGSTPPSRGGPPE